MAFGVEDLPERGADEGTGAEFEPVFLEVGKILLEFQPLAGGGTDRVRRQEQDLFSAIHGGVAGPRCGLRGPRYGIIEIRKSFRIQEGNGIFTLRGPV
jgi:hypothetical protein